MISSLLPVAFLFALTDTNIKIYTNTISVDVGESLAEIMQCKYHLITQVLMYGLRFKRTFARTLHSLI